MYTNLLSIYVRHTQSQGYSLRSEVLQIRIRLWNSRSIPLCQNAKYLLSVGSKFENVRGYYYVSVLSKRGRIKRCTLSLCPSVCPVNDPNSRTERRRKFIFDLRGCVTRVTSRASTSFVWLFRGMGHITRWTLSVCPSPSRCRSELENGNSKKARIRIVDFSSPGVTGADKC